jgi:hypothetical protein
VPGSSDRDHAGTGGFIPNGEEKIATKRRQRRNEAILNIQYLYALEIPRFLHFFIVSRFCG